MGLEARSYQDIVCQKLQRSVQNTLSYTRKTSRHFFVIHGSTLTFRTMKVSCISNHNLSLNLNQN